MAKKQSAVVFKPISNTASIKQEIEKIDNAELVNYKDVGVSFNGYAKVKISNTQWKLLRQERFHSSGNYALFAIGSPASFNFNTIKDKTLYLTNINISTNLAAQSPIVFIGDGGKVIASYRAPAGVNTFNFDFKIPLPLYSGTLQMAYAEDNSYIVNVEGFLEDKS